ncbi:MAG TPA: hypothetical protein VGN07_23300 [Steroidobacteraceae bacterium]
MSSPVLLLLSTLAFSLPAHGLEIERSEARYADKHYQFEFVALLDAPVDKVEAVLRDYEKYPELDGRILDAHVLERTSDYAVTLATTLRACFGPFCRNVKRVERVEESPLELKAVTDPQQSDVRFGETRTMLSVSEGRTRVSYRTSIIPGFWVPAIAGRRWLLNELRDATTELFGNVEIKAREVNQADNKAEAAVTNEHSTDLPTPAGAEGTPEDPPKPLQ